MTLTKEQKKYVTAVAKQVSALETEQDKLYKMACQTLGTNDTQGWLFDVLYNEARIESLEYL